MKEFEYEGIGADDDKHYKGIMPAINCEDVVGKLLARGIIPSRIEEVSRAHTGVANQIAGLKKLRVVLGGTPEKQAPKPKRKEVTTKRPKDWSYLVFVLVVAAVLVYAFWGLDR